MATIHAVARLAESKSLLILCHRTRICDGLFGYQGPIWENPWDDRDQMRLKLHELGTTLKRYGPAAQSYPSPLTGGRQS